MDSHLPTAERRASTKDLRRRPHGDPPASRPVIRGLIVRSSGDEPKRRLEGAFLRILKRRYPGVVWDDD